jgi:glycosyltransferase involved in cell wall biosynthesis
MALKPLVEVLMSTYDGERYVREQVASILHQSHCRLRLAVRDDGSRDGTAAVLRSLDDPRLKVRTGENLGLPQSFFRLIDESSDDADLWALSDQDDVWSPEKLARAVSRLAQVDGPAMYCARVAVVDQDLRSLYLHELPWRGPSFANALVQNIALGCTIVINREARDLLRGRWPRECVMHDAWMYLVVAGCGTVVYDHEPVVLYRQHGRNSVGMGRGPWSRLAGRVRRQLSLGGAGKHGRQDCELLRLHADRLTPTSRSELEQFLAARRCFFRRFCYIMTGMGLHRQTRGSNVVLRGLQLLGRI